MSFGFSIGDFIAVIELANRLRKDFIEAPSQFKAISDEVRSLSIVLQDTDVACQNQELSDDQKKDLEDIDNGCRNVLDELQRIVDKSSEFTSENGSVGKRIKRVWKRLNWKPEDIEKLRSRIVTNIGLLNAFNGRLARDNVVKLVQHQENQEWQAILNWLSEIPSREKQRHILKSRQQGTCEFLLKSQIFKSWLDGTERVLWCIGPPGTGKTVLTSTVIETLDTTLASPAVAIAFIYCTYAERHAQTIEQLLGSLIQQLLLQSIIPEDIVDLYKSHKRSNTRPDVVELSTCLRSVASFFSKVYIVVDALDECNESDKTRSSLLIQLRSLAKHVQLFFASRPLGEIESLRDAAVFKIRAQEDDMRKYLSAKIQQEGRLTELCTKHRGLKEEILDNIIAKADGMFLLTNLHLQFISSQLRLKAVRKALQALPDKLYNTYSDTVKRIQSGQERERSDLAMKVLMLLSYTLRPLKLGEIQHALLTMELDINETNIDMDDVYGEGLLVTICAGIVILEDETTIIRFVHHTAETYFESNREKLFKDAQIEFTRACVRYLSFDGFKGGLCQTDDEFEERLRSNPLYDYAAHNWGHHAREASTSCHAIIEFLHRKAQVEASSQALMAFKRWPYDLGYSQRIPKQMTRLHLAAYFGVKAIVKLVLKAGGDVAAADSYGRTPLSYAAARGHEATVQLLLEKGANADSKDVDSQTPLSYATSGVHEAIVQLLLEKGVNVDSNDEENRTPLSYAASRGHKAIVQLLLEKGANAGSEDEDNQTPLSYAAENGHEAIVQLLLEKGAKADSKNKDNQTPLLYAAENGHEAIVQLLLEKGINVDLKDTYSRTPLLYAAENGHKAIVQLLLEKGANADSKDEDNRTPLSYAAEDGHEAIVQLLLEKGANIDSNDEENRTPLSYAASRGHKTIVQLLLEKGANADSKDVDNRTPLSYAASRGNEAIVQLLLEKGVNVR